MLETTVDDGIALLRMDHGKVNALDLALCEGLADEVRRLDVDVDVRAVVLTGNGRAFGAGVDLPALLALDDAGIARFLSALADVVMAPVLADTPFVAAVDGHAIAGGAIIAMACDHVLVTDDARARLGLSELAVGVPFPPVPLELARHRLTSTEPIVTAALYGAPDAVARGFGHEVVAADQLLDRATAVARRLGAVPPTTWRLTKAALRRPLEQALAGSDALHAEAAAAWATDEVRTAIRRFVASL